MGYQLHSDRGLLMRPAFAIIILAASLSACGGEYQSCNTKSFREVDWDEVPRRMDFSAEDFAEAFRPAWRLEVLWDQVPAGYLDPLPASFRSLWQGWNWTWRPDASLPVYHNALRTDPPRNCNLHTTGNPEGIDHLFIPGSVQAESDDGVWSFEGTQLLVAWAVPTDENPVYVASATESLPEEYPGSGRFTNAHEAFYADAAEVVRVQYGTAPVLDDSVVYLEGPLTIPNLTIEVVDEGEAWDGAMVGGAGLSLVPVEP
jgi:hypothetical protein